MAYLLADPSSTLNYSFDWETSWLPSGTIGSPTDTIASRLWTITPPNPGSPNTPTLVGETTDVVFVSGLLAGYVYRLVERVTTVAGITDDRTIVIRAEHT
jgi:hypothetical protein